MRRFIPALLAAAVAVGLAACAGSSMVDAPMVVPAPVRDERSPAAGTETVVLAGGCFWGVQGVFQHVKGVTSAVSGYAGGSRADAHYDLVSSGTTGHAESVSVTFDPSVVSYGTILRVYFSVVHDPTQLNRQGPDHGTQYRSAIFPTNAGQARLARAYIDQLDRAHVFDGRVVTTVEPGRTFYAAERFHQNYLVDHPHQPYVAINDVPKVAALKHGFPRLYREQPMLVR